GEEERLREDLKTGLQRKKNHLNDRRTGGYNWNVPKLICSQNFVNNKVLPNDIQKQEIGSCPMGCYGLLRLIYYVSLGSRTLPNQTGYWDVWNYRASWNICDQFDKTDVHYDTSSKADNPRWSMV
uniref:Uncharacterized protein n=1 Tax=Oncorhynchus kisutch TaxID=8019 RepID=A0A8C7G3P3_ONCKI